MLNVLSNFLMIYNDYKLKFQNHYLLVIKHAFYSYINIHFFFKLCKFDFNILFQNKITTIKGIEC